MGYTPNAIPNLWNTIVSKYVDYNETSVNQKVHYDGNIYIFNIATKLYSETSTYNVNDYCIHDQGYYKCIVAITEGETWTAAHWQSITEAEWIAATATTTKVFDKIKDYNKFIAPEFSSSATYPNQYQYTVWHNDKLYYNLVEINTPEEWNDAHWEEYEDDWLYTLIDDYITYDSIIYPFWEDENYGPGELVRHNHGLYRAKRNIAAGEWNADDWADHYIVNEQCDIIHGNDISTYLLFPKTGSGTYRGRPSGTIMYSAGDGYIAKLSKDAFEYYPGCTYAVGDLIHDYDNNCFWKCTTAITTPHTFNESEWSKCTTNVDLGSNSTKLATEIERRSFATDFAPSFENTSAAEIAVGALFTYNGRMYMCKTPIEAGSATKEYVLGDIIASGGSYYICTQAGSGSTVRWWRIQTEDRGIVINKHFQEITYNVEMEKQLSALATKLGLTRTITYNETTKEFEYSFA